MKTPMQELIDWLDKDGDNRLYGGRELTAHEIKNRAKSMLEKEKEVMESSWNDGHQVGRFEGKEIADEGFSSFEFYYNETFNTKEK